MVAAAQPSALARPAGDADARVLLHDVPWATYVVLRDTVDGPGLRMTYLEGVLEIIGPSRLHEVSKTQIARLLELFCLERGIALYGYGSTTMRREDKERGLEPDECYCRGSDRGVPELAIEVIVSSPLLDKLEVYRGLGVREVWQFEQGAFRVLVLQDEAYAPADTSVLFPEVDLERLAHWVREPDQARAVIGYRDELRAR